MFSTGFDTARNFLDKTAYLPGFDTAVIGKGFLVKNAISSHPEGCYLHLTSLPWSLCQCAPGKGNWAPAAPTAWWSLHRGDPRLHMCLLGKRARTREQSYKKALLRRGREGVRTPNLILQRGLLLRVGLESEALGRAELGQSSWCQRWRDGNAASNTCFQFPVAKKRFCLIIQMPALNILKW